MEQVTSVFFHLPVIDRFSCIHCKLWSRLLRSFQIQISNTFGSWSCALDWGPGISSNSKRVCLFRVFYSSGAVGLLSKGLENFVAWARGCDVFGSTFEVAFCTLFFWLLRISRIHPLFGVKACDYWVYSTNCCVSPRTSGLTIFFKAKSISRSLRKPF